MIDQIPDIQEEAEISFELDKQTLKAVRDFLRDERGLQWRRKREGTRLHPVTYWDTEQFHYLKQKKELRVKPSGDTYNQDLKIPIKQGHALWSPYHKKTRLRYEIKLKDQYSSRPNLAAFGKLPLLAELKKLAKKPLKKKAVSLFQSFVAEEKIGDGVVEYKIDIGYFMHPEDGRICSPWYYLFEIEYKSGKRRCLNKARKVLKKKFGKRLAYQKRPKIILAYDTLYGYKILPAMKTYKKARKHFTKAKWPKPDKNAA